MMELPIEVVKHVLKKGLTPEDSAQLLEKYSDIRAKVLDRDRKIARIRKTALPSASIAIGQNLCTESTMGDVIVPRPRAGSTDERRSISGPREASGGM